jgi:hypothetical protein
LRISPQYRFKVRREQKNIDFQVNIKSNHSGGVAELATASIVHSSDPSSNLNIDKKSDSVCFGFESKFEWALTI